MGDGGGLDGRRGCVIAIEPYGCRRQPLAVSGWSAVGTGPRVRSEPMGGDDRRVVCWRGEWGTWGKPGSRRL